MGFRFVCDVFEGVVEDLCVNDDGDVCEVNVGVK